MHLIPKDIQSIIYRYIFDSDYRLVLDQLKTVYGNELELSVVPMLHSCRRIMQDTVVMHLPELCRLWAAYHFLPDEGPSNSDHRFTMAEWRRAKHNKY